ncbi:class III extradiol dioxygenase subunit B-like domain-containing protein [Streptomyces longwoodensis]|uniref:class III extradiol dioxygenase subunit B-like domain-containing protein n=1 Tax=Streptomyces longwoodensis TaxID=68231 RepID=UPI003403228C
MLVAAAVCPCPPLLVPEVAAGAAPELDGARAACVDALGVLAAARPDRLVVVGAVDEPGHALFPEGSPGTFRGFGVDLDVRLGRPDPAGADLPSLPPSLAVAAWLLQHVNWADAPVEALAVDQRLAPERCLGIGRETGTREGRVALLVMGDGSACRTLKAPGYLDERAAPFDAEAARALREVDLAALRGLHADLAHELQASGRAPWQVLAGAAEGAQGAQGAGGAGLGGTLLYDDAPYGVGYLVAAWS